jgi:chemotaxis protein CheC
MERKGLEDMTNSGEMFNEKLIAYMQVLANEGLPNAAVGFSNLLGQTMTVTEPVVRIVPFADIPNMFGGPEEEAVGIYLKVEGDMPGQMILVIPYPKALELTALLLDVPMESIHMLGSLERSALGEMGNMTGSFFLNSVAKLTGLSVRPSPPAVMVDMVGAILDVIIATTGDLGSYVLMLQATFVFGDRQTETDFWVIPDSNTLKFFAKKADAGV